MTKQSGRLQEYKSAALPAHGFTMAVNGQLVYYPALREGMLVESCLMYPISLCHRFRRLSLAVFCSLASLFAFTAAYAQTRFYAASEQELAGRPGTIIRQERMAGAPLGAQAYRVLYRSTGLQDQPIAVSGVIIVPPGPAPAGGRAIVAWAHPTTGVVPHCAPSLANF